MRYPIRAASRLTGLSADTLRAWERRYDAVRPARGERGRLYSDEDVERLNLLREAVERGHAISQVAGLSREDLRSFASGGAAAAEGDDGSGPAGALSAHGGFRSILRAIERFDAIEADRELGRLATLLPPRELVHRVTIPLLRAVGEGWEAGKISIAQEHLLSGVLRSLLGALMRVHAPARAAATLLFATPPGEEHEFGILTAALLAAGGGLGVIYLGSGLPAREIVNAAEKTSSSVVVLGLVGASDAPEPVATFHEVARDLAPRTELWVGGARSDALVRELGTTRALVLRDFAVLEQHLTRLGARF